MQIRSSLVAPWLFALVACSAAPSNVGSNQPLTPDKPTPRPSATTTTTAPAPTVTPTAAPTTAPTTPPVDPPPEDNTPIGDYKPVSDETLSSLIKSQNRVAADLYLALSKDQDNFAMSPTSISLAFGMVYAGAQKNTAAQMKKVFRYDLPQSEVHAAFGTALRQWKGKKNAKRAYELAVANRLFGEKEFDFRDGFLGVTRDHYAAPLERLDFRNHPEPARHHINSWIAKQTNNRIKGLLPKDSIQEATSLVLTNAIFFKGKWKQAFNEKLTQKRDFTTPSGVVKTKMMNLTGRHRFAHHDGVKMLQMGYVGDDLAMQLVLPDKAADFDALEKKLESGILDTLANKMGGRQVIVSLPRFTIAPEKPLALSDALKAMGMTDAWDLRTANLRNMAVLKPKQNLFIQEAFHKAFVEVQEKGTEAAAATAVVVNVGTTSVRPPPPPPARFNADHPFLFVIRDLKTNAILFVGRVLDPNRK